MRIIAGTLRGQKITLPKLAKQLRPTMSMAKEAVFNLLVQGRWNTGNPSILEGARVLDLYCGSAAMAFEAISRGASYATVIDINSQHIAAVKKSVSDLKIDDKVTVVKADSSMPPFTRTAADLIFIDPPYHKGLLEKTLLSIITSGWLHEGTVLVIELAKKEQVTLPEGYCERDTRIYGASKMILAKWEPSAEQSPSEENSSNFIDADAKETSLTSSPSKQK